MSGPAAENKPDDRWSSSSPATAFPDNTVNEGESDTTDYYVRHLWDGKASAAIEDTGPKALARYARLCGAVFARAHARSGDATAISGYLGDDDTFDRAVTTYAIDYARRNEQDHTTILAAITSGQLPVIRGI